MSFSFSLSFLFSSAAMVKARAWLIMLKHAWPLFISTVNIYRCCRVPGWYPLRVGGVAASQLGETSLSFPGWYPLRMSAWCRCESPGENLFKFSCISCVRLSRISFSNCLQCCTSSTPYPCLGRIRPPTSHKHVRSNSYTVVHP